MKFATMPPKAINARMIVICDSGVGPRQVLYFMSDFLKQEADLGFRMALLGLKLSWLGTLSPAVHERTGLTESPRR